MSQTPIMPKFYSYSRWGSEKGWIMVRMAVIPAHKQQEVADEYDRLYMAKNYSGRRQANEYLNGVAREYREYLRAQGRIA